MTLLWPAAAFIAGMVIAVMADAMAIVSGSASDSVIAWVQTNLGLSAVVFLLVLLFIGHTLNALISALGECELDPTRIFYLENQYDIGASLLFGTGVLFTAVGIRDALTEAILPGQAATSPTDVLGALVSGGILSALTTTIVGGALGYGARLLKNVVVGAELERFHSLCVDRAGARQEQLLQNIHSLLKEMQDSRRV
jgi:hypothetical protein